MNRKYITLAILAVFLASTAFIPAVATDGNDIDNESNAVGPLVIDKNGVVSGTGLAKPSDYNATYDNDNKILTLNGGSFTCNCVENRTAILNFDKVNMTVIVNGTTEISANKTSLTLYGGIFANHCNMTIAGGGAGGKIIVNVPDCATADNDVFAGLRSQGKIAINGCEIVVNNIQKPVAGVKCGSLFTVDSKITVNGNAAITEPQYGLQIRDVLEMRYSTFEAYNVVSGIFPYVMASSDVTYSSLTCAVHQCDVKIIGNDKVRNELIRCNMLNLSSSKLKGNTGAFNDYTAGETGYYNSAIRSALIRISESSVELTGHAKGGGYTPVSRLVIFNQEMYVKNSIIKCVCYGPDENVGQVLNNHNAAIHGFGGSTFISDNSIIEINHSCGNDETVKEHCFGISADCSFYRSDVSIVTNSNAFSYEKIVYLDESTSQLQGSNDGNYKDITVDEIFNYSMIKIVGDGDCYVVFSLNGGQGTEIEPTGGHKVGDKMTLPGCDATKNGMKFKGWEAASDGKLYKPGDTYTIQGDVIFVAVYEGEGPSSSEIDGMLPLAILVAIVVIVLLAMILYYGGEKRKG